MVAPARIHGAAGKDDRVAAMKLVSWNIQWGLGRDGRVDLERIAASARAMADFDVLCLQEVADGFDDLPGLDGENQFAAIAALLPGFVAVEGIAIDISGPRRRRRFGNLLLSRLRVGQVLRHALPWEPDGQPGMPRLLIDVVVHAPMGPVRIMTTHLEYYSAAGRAAQIEAVRRIHRSAVERHLRPPADKPGPFAAQPSSPSALLAGDFNMPPDAPEKARLEEPFDDGHPRFVDAWQAVHPGAPHPPSFRLETAVPPYCCDYVFVTADLVPRLRAMAYDPDTRASDHQPVMVDIDLG